VLADIINSLLIYSPVFSVQEATCYRWKQASDEDYEKHSHEGLSMSTSTSCPQWVMFGVSMEVGGQRRYFATCCSRAWVPNGVDHPYHRLPNLRREEIPPQMLNVSFAFLL